jgi:CheY-like chemotaxis protein
VIGPAKRILIVEDEVILALDFEDAIAELGYEVVGPALSLDHGLRLATSEAIDCALLDVNLGRGLTSQPIADALRARGIRFAFVTAYTREQVDFARPDEKVLHKPPEPATLQRVVSELCF